MSFDHDEWVAAGDAGRKVAVDSLLERLGSDWEHEQLADVGGFPVAFFTHQPTATRFVLVPGGRFEAGWTAADSTRFATLIGAEASSWPSHGWQDVPAFLIAVRPLEAWALGELLERTDVLADGGAGGLILPEFLPAAIDRLGARGWRLPSEFEWEFAVRGGTRTFLVDGRNSIPEDPFVGANSLGLRECGVGAETVTRADGTLAARGGSGHLYPWQGPDYLLSVVGAPSVPIWEFFAAIRPVVVLPIARGPRAFPPWSRVARDDVSSVARPLPRGVPEKFADPIEIESELDLRELLTLDAEGAARMAQRLLMCPGFLHRDDHDLPMSLARHHATRERGRLLAWIVTTVFAEDDLEAWRLELEELRRDEDQAVRAAAAFVLEPEVLPGDGPVALLSVVIATRKNTKYRELRAELAKHADRAVAASASDDTTEAIASVQLPEAFPLPVEEWWKPLLNAAPGPSLDGALERRVAMPCSTFADAELRDLAAERWVSPNFRYLGRGAVPPPFTERQKAIIELLRRVKAKVVTTRYGFSI